MASDGPSLPFRVKDAKGSGVALTGEADKAGGCQKGLWYLNPRYLAFLSGLLERSNGGLQVK